MYKNNRKAAASRKMLITLFQRLSHEGKVKANKL